MIREPNHPRKAERVDLPLQVEIAGVRYPARDWSTDGLAVAGLPQPPAPGELLQACLHVPLQEASLLIPVQLLARRSDGDGVGFEFRDLSPHNRRILRQYMELGQQRQLGGADDILAVGVLPATQPAAEPAVPLPVPPQELLSPHRTRPWGALFLGLAVLAGAAGLAWYNLTYELEGTGFVSGSMMRVTANHEGRIGRMLVQPGTRVDPETPLFAIENPALRHELDALEQHVAQLAEEQARLAREQVRYEAERRRAEAGLLNSLRHDWDQRERDLANARRLYASGAITQRDMLVVADQVGELRRNYLRQVAEGVAPPRQPPANDALNRLRLELATKKVMLARQEAERVVRAPVRGKVFHVDRQAGEFVAAQDPVLLLEADVTPSVLLRVPDDRALKLRIGMPATIYVPFEDRRYRASVAAVGLAAAAGSAATALEGDGAQTLVRLEFDDRSVRLPANARVNVWIRNPALPWG